MRLQTRDCMRASSTLLVASVFDASVLLESRQFTSVHTHTDCATPSRETQADVAAANFTFATAPMGASSVRKFAV